MRILLIEPDVVLARMYRSALNTAGHEIVHATTSQAAIMAADQQSPDMVLLEMQLPQHNGIAFLQEFQSYTDWQDIPVILHTYVPAQAHGDARLVMQHEYGIRHWLYKPRTSLQQLIAVVQGYVTEDVDAP